MKSIPQKLGISFFVVLFAFFPLTDTDVWWHLASAREFFRSGLPIRDPFCWTPSKTPWVNIHLFFQMSIYGVHRAFGTDGLVAFKSLLWGVVAFLWLLPVSKKFNLCGMFFAVLFAFLLRYSLECRPVLFSLFFLGVFWNLLPILSKKLSVRWVICAGTLLLMEWFWCRSQGLFALGWVISFLFIAVNWKRIPLAGRLRFLIFAVLLLIIPLLHRQGFLVWAYPFPLLNRLMGISSDASIFASQISENRSPFTLLFNGENMIAMGTLLVAAFASIVLSIRAFLGCSRTGDWHDFWRFAWLFIAAILALVAERNAVLLLFPFISLIFENENQLICVENRMGTIPFTALIAFVLGFWVKSLFAYISPNGFESVAEARVPKKAVEFMKSHPIPANMRLFNDDRSGGYIEWSFPGIKTYADGRFILKDSAFFAGYLGFASSPESFLVFAQEMNVGRVLLPVRYFSIWNPLVAELSANPLWKRVYIDPFYVVFDGKILNRP